MDKVIHPKPHTAEASTPHPKPQPDPLDPHPRSRRPGARRTTKR